MRRHKEKDSMAERRKVLVVDDEPTNIEIVVEILEENYILRAAASGEEALREVYAFRPDIMLLDIMMPGIDGYRVCRAVKSDEALRETKIVLLSAKAMAEDIEAGFAAGADGYLTKPFMAEELKGLLEKHLHTGRSVDRAESV